ncbi:hypothetical protein LMG18091_00212 [Ralstonia wenshanensis]|uniref:Uncharacterized protein n=1 Tax=Ralstonia wenshanensis TaxID=2842456 RepID=A0AAD2AN25_9RALS|nr:hypothetical protein LMG18091_00212 [Ralstonia wenshanensis]
MWDLFTDVVCSEPSVSFVVHVAIHISLLCSIGSYFDAKGYRLHVRDVTDVDANLLSAICSNTFGAAVNISCPVPYFSAG